MKVKWWIVVLVFFLGILVGSGMNRRNKAEQTGAIIISQPAATAAPTLPDAKPVAGTNPQTGFPFALEYTSLVAQKLIAYEGAYLEDGSQEPVTDIAALILENTGTTGIQYTQIVVVQNGRELTFDATYIPPKSTILLLEENKQPYSDAPATACRCRTVIPGVFDRGQRIVQIQETGLCTLEVTNLTGQTLNGIRIFYKHHEAASDLYVGGITYSTVIPTLEPGAALTITPYRYASGYAQVVAVVPE